ncbi:MAG TPA: class I SAM-dependent methyltransferase, partial [Candidatus Berkiella sp.]|nr:class I SAM-dependent methyltransferase [Candidatus Berkiella sp.]
MANALTEIASGEDSMIYMDENYIYRLLPKLEADFFLNVVSKLAPKLQEDIISALPIQQDVGVKKNIDQVILAHKKIQFISYPHEWCASMLKDAALFHLKLQMGLLNSDLYLKDAHPWNILFEKGKFKFVDLPSIITKNKLENIDYVPAPSGELNREHYYFNQIMKIMFVPYFFKPICGYAYGKRSWVQKRLEQTTLNASTDFMKLKDCFPQKKVNGQNILRVVKLLQNTRKVESLLSSQSGGIEKNLAKLYKLIQHIDVSIGHSAYKNYYALKGEANPYEYNSAWNAKQKNVHRELQDGNILSVMDVACNTGWYSIMAEKLGKQVVALDHDEACIEELYNQVTMHSYNILPIWRSFLELTQNRYSISSGKKVLIDFAERMQCDAVIALGIVHHLVLGMGLTFETIFEKFQKCTKKKLVVEFVHLDDEMIVKHTEFFAAYHKDKSQFRNYDIEIF